MANSEKVVYDDTDGYFYTDDNAGGRQAVLPGGTDGVVWDDEKLVPGAELKAGNNDPVSSTWQPGGSGTTYTVYKFNQSDELFFTIQFSHKRKESSDILGHIHWTPGDRGNEESGNTVAWKIDYSWAKIDGTFPASSTIDCTDTCTGTDHVHLMTPEGTIDGSSIDGVSSMMVGRIYRDTGDTWTGVNTQAPILLELDFHYQIDTVGSETYAAK